MGARFFSRLKTALKIWLGYERATASGLKPLKLIRCCCGGGHKSLPGDRQSRRCKSEIRSGAENN
jgi:hypothetical protein